MIKKKVRETGQTIMQAMLPSNDKNHTVKQLEIAKNNMRIHIPKSKLKVTFFCSIGG